MIGTHGADYGEHPMPPGCIRDKFHTDEVLACIILKLLPEFKEHKIVRTRDPKVLAECDVLVDVGGVFNHETHRYDHHQNGFKHTMRTLKGIPYDTLLSSAGLVFAFFGERIIAQLLNIDEQDEKVTMIFSQVYEDFIEEIDYVDNGRVDITPPRVVLGRCEVGELNPNGMTTPDDVYDKIFEAAFVWLEGTFLRKIYKHAEGLNIPLPSFERHSDIMLTELQSDLRKRYPEYCLDSKAYDRAVLQPAKETVARALKTRYNIHSSGQILVMSATKSKRGIPWKRHFFKSEKWNHLQQCNILYVVYYSNRTWRVQCIPRSKDAKKDDCRSLLPEAWWGLNNEDLSRIARIDGCVFVMNTGYMGGNKTKSGAIKMAISALEDSKRQERKSRVPLACSSNLDISHNKSNLGNGVCLIKNKDKRSSNH